MSRRGTPSVRVAKREPTDVDKLRAAAEVLESWGYHKTGESVSYIATHIERALEAARQEMQTGKVG